MHISSTDSCKHSEMLSFPFETAKVDSPVKLDEGKCKLKTYLAAKNDMTV
jgi:hypothetical protein